MWSNQKSWRLYCFSFCFQFKTCIKLKLTGYFGEAEILFGNKSQLAEFQSDITPISLKGKTVIKTIIVPKKRLQYFNQVFIYIYSSTVNISHILISTVATSEQFYYI